MECQTCNLIPGQPAEPRAVGRRIARFAESQFPFKDVLDIQETDLAPADWIISSADRFGDRVRFTTQTGRIDRLEDYLAGAGGRCGRAGSGWPVLVPARAATPEYASIARDGLGIIVKPDFTWNTFEEETAGS